MELLNFSCNTEGAGLADLEVDNRQLLCRYNVVCQDPLLRKLHGSQKSVQLVTILPSPTPSRLSHRFQSGNIEHCVDTLTQVPPLAGHLAVRSQEDRRVVPLHLPRLLHHLQPDLLVILPQPDSR